MYQGEHLVEPTHMFGLFKVFEGIEEHEFFAIFYQKPIFNIFVCFFSDYKINCHMAAGWGLQQTTRAPLVH